MVVSAVTQQNNIKTLLYYAYAQQNKSPWPEEQKQIKRLTKNQSKNNEHHSATKLCSNRSNNALSLIYQTTMAIAKTITLAPFVLAEYTILRLGYDICTKRLWLCLNIVGFNQLAVAVSPHNVLINCFALFVCFICLHNCVCSIRTYNIPQYCQRPDGRHPHPIQHWNHP